MKSTQIIRVTPPHLPANTDPSDVVLSQVFNANLASQEASGTADAAVSVERTLHGLRPGPQSEPHMFALIAREPGETEDYLDVPAQGDDRNFDYLGYLTVTLPLRENTDTAEVAVTLDAGLAPLPGEELSPEAVKALRRLYQLAADVAREHGRGTLQAGLMTSPSIGVDGDPRVRLMRELGFELAYQGGEYLVELGELPAAPLPEGIAATVFEGVSPPEPLVDGFLELLRIASTDVPHGSLRAEPANWSRERLAEVAAHSARLGSQLVNVVLSDAYGPVGFSYASRHPGSNPAVAEQDLTVIHPRARRQGLGTAIKAILWRELRTRHPEVRRVCTFVSDDNAAMRAINAKLGATLTAIETVWQKRV